MFNMDFDLNLDLDFKHPRHREQESWNYFHVLPHIIQDGAIGGPRLTYICKIMSIADHL
jgi:hypothetical protein